MGSIQSTATSKRQLQREDFRDRHETNSKLRHVDAFFEKVTVNVDDKRCGRIGSGC